MTIDNKSKTMTRNKKTSKAMRSWVTPSPFQSLKNQRSLRLFLNRGKLFQHFSDPLQFLLNGDQKLMRFSVGSFLYQF
jgi:hypothetical protein